MNLLINERLEDCRKKLEKEAEDLEAALVYARKVVTHRQTRLQQVKDAIIELASIVGRE